MPNKKPKAVRKQTSSWLLNELVYLSVSVQFSSDSLRPHGLQPPGFPIHHQIPELAQTHVHQVSNAIQPSHSLLPLLLLPSIFPSNRIFSNESVFCIRWTKYWSFSFSISPSNEYSGLIAFRMDWLDLPAVKGTLKSLLQHHSLKASILQALSFLYSPTLTSIHDYWKNHSFD